MSDAAQPSATPDSATKPVVSIPRKLFRFFASYGFAVVLLLFLMLLTLLGTLEQRSMSLFEVQQKYFESYLVRHEFFGVPLMLPGVYLLLLLLSVNLLFGGFIRIRKSKSTIGVLVIHLGIVTMLAGGLVEFHASNKGHMTLYEGEESAEFQSYYEWEITVRKAGGDTEFIIPGQQFVDLGPDKFATFHRDGVPFELVVGSVAKNSEVLPASQRKPHEAAEVDGYFLRELEGNLNAERDAAGLYVRAVEPEGKEHDGILWGRTRIPWSVVAKDDIWYVNVQRRRFPVPFTIRLEDFRRELHPRLSMAAAFESDVVKAEGGTEQKINISMNEPLRHAGFTFFQSGWGPDDARPGQNMYSVFSVVQNPADDLPLIACIIMTAGLLIHFVGKLVGHVRKERRRTA